MLYADVVKRHRRPRDRDGLEDSYQIFPDGIISDQNELKDCYYIAMEQESHPQFRPCTLWLYRSMHCLHPSFAVNS